MIYAIEEWQERIQQKDTMCVLGVCVLVEINGVTYKRGTKQECQIPLFLKSPVLDSQE